MTIHIDEKSQILCLWSGVLFLVCFGLGLALIAGLVPPPSPALGADAIKTLFVDHAWRIKAGCFVTMMGAPFQVPLFVVLMCQMARMERGVPIMGITQLAVSAFNCAFFILGPVLWVTAAFREDIAPEIVRAINDFGWILYFFIISPAILANIAIAIAIFRDYNQAPIMPRWFAYLNLWVAVLFLPAGIMPFFKTGPFAWDGIISFWLVIAAFSAWFIALLVCLAKAIRGQGDVTLSSGLIGEPT